MPATPVLEPVSPWGCTEAQACFHPAPGALLGHRAPIRGLSEGDPNAVLSGDCSGSQDNLRVPNELSSQGLLLQTPGVGGHTAEVTGCSFLRAGTSCVTSSDPAMWPGPRVSLEVSPAVPVQITAPPGCEKLSPCFPPVFLRTPWVQSHILNLNMKTNT